MLQQQQRNLQHNRDYTIVHCPKMDYYVIYCKSKKGMGMNNGTDIQMYRSTSKWIDADWVKVDDTKHSITVTNLLQGYREEDVDPNNFDLEGVSAFTKGSRVYLIVSMREKIGVKQEDAPQDEEKEEPSSTTTTEEERPTHIMIVRMKPNFVDLVENPQQRVVFFERLDTNIHRDAFWLFKRRDTYYMTYSGRPTSSSLPSSSPTSSEDTNLITSGSDCYYRTASQLKGPWSNEQSVQFVHSSSSSASLTQEDDTTIRSFASQHRYIMKINDQWVYGGDRLDHYQEEETQISNNDGRSSSSYHSNIIVPVKWKPLVGKPDQPVVTWKQEWDIVNYDGSGPDSLFLLSTICEEEYDC